MGEIASQGQLRMSLMRWALVTVPAIVLLGFLSGRLGGAGGQSRWWQALDKPSFQPPDWAFGIAWSLLYVLLGVALAIILNARGARGRGLAIGLFGLNFLLSLAWTPLFFGAHQVSAALILLAAVLVTGVLTAWQFWRIRPLAGGLLLPYLAWLVFALALNAAVDRLNPDAETFVPPVPAAEVIL